MARKRLTPEQAAEQAAEKARQARIAQEKSDAQKRQQAAQIGLNVSPELLEQAWRAMKESQALLPGLRAIARTITRDPKTDVFFGPGTPCTEGTRIRLRVPLALGKMPDHQRVKCDSYDKFGLPECERCRVLEEITSTLQHETAHIAHGSFDTLSDEDKAQILKRVIDERPAIAGSRAEKLQQVLDQLDKQNDLNYWIVSAAISPYLKTIVNALEDARVNQSLIKARSGLLRQFRASVAQVMDKGVEHSDGSFHLWREADPSMQAMLSLYFRAAGYDDLVNDTNFLPEVVAAAFSPEVGSELLKFRNIRGITGVYGLAFPMLEALRAHGFCKRHDDPEDDPEPKPEPEQQPEPQDKDEDQDQDEKKPGEDQEPAEEDGDDAAQPGDDEDTEDGADADDDSDDFAHGGETDDDGEGDFSGDDWKDSDDAEAEYQPGEADDEAPDDDFEPEIDPSEIDGALDEMFGHDDFNVDQEEAAATDAAAGQGSWFDAPSGFIQGVRIHREDAPIYGLNYGNNITSSLTGWGDSYRYSSRYNTTGDYTPEESMMAASVSAGRRVFTENAAGKNKLNQRVGRVNGRDLARVPTGFDKPFMQRRLPGRKDWFVIIGIDVSGSTGSAFGSDTVIEVLKRAVRAQADLMARLGIDFALYAHTAYPADDGTYGMMVDLIEVKSPEEPWGDRQKSRLAKLIPASDNLDGHTLEQYRKIAMAQPATDKVILYYTDGAMPAANGREEGAILHRETALIKQQDNLHLMAAGLGTDSPAAWGMETTVIEGPDDLPLVVEALRKKLIGS